MKMAMRTTVLEVLLSSSPDLNDIIEPNGKLLYANTAFAEFFGKSPDDGRSRFSFAMLIDVTDPTHIDAVAPEIIEELRRLFTLEAGEATISASIGVAVYPGDGDTPEELG